MFSTNPVADASRHYDAQGSRASAIAAAAKGLESDFVEAAYASPRTMIPTPGFGVQRQELHAVVFDGIGGVGNEDALIGLLEIVRDAASGRADTAAAGARAWIAAQAKAFGAWHASDLVDAE